MTSGNGGFQVRPDHQRLEVSLRILQDKRSSNSQVDLLTKNLPPPYEFRISPPRLPCSVPGAVVLDGEHVDLLFERIGQEPYMRKYSCFDVWRRVRSRIPLYLGI
jgi:hypothetical protein